MRLPESVHHYHVTGVVFFIEIMISYFNKKKKVKCEFQDRIRILLDLRRSDPDPVFSQGPGRSSLPGPESLPASTPPAVRGTPGTCWRKGLTRSGPMSTIQLYTPRRLQRTFLNLLIIFFLYV